MKGFRFHAEMPEARGSKSASKSFPFFPWTVKALRTRAEESGFQCAVTAVELDENGRLCWNDRDSFGMVAQAISENPYSYGYCSGSREYLRKRTTRIPESLARKLSPELFTYLES